MTDTDEDVRAAEFQKKVKIRPGEWDFKDFWQRPQTDSGTKEGVTAASLAAIVEGTHRDMRLGVIKDLLGGFAQRHTNTLNEFADFLTARMKGETGYRDSPIYGIDKYKDFMNSYIDVLRKAASEFKKIGDPDSKSTGKELLKGWVDDAKHARLLDEVLCLANDRAKNKNDLVIPESILADKVKAAYDDMAPITESFRKLITQKSQISFL